MKTRRTLERRPGKHCVSPYLNVEQNLLKKAAKPGPKKNDKPGTVKYKIREFSEQEEKIIQFVCDPKLDDTYASTSFTLEHIAYDMN